MIPWVSNPGHRRPPGSGLCSWNFYWRRRTHSVQCTMLTGSPVDRETFQVFQLPHKSRLNLSFCVSQVFQIRWHASSGIFSFPALCPPFNWFPLHITFFSYLLVNLIPFFQSFDRLIRPCLALCPLIIDRPAQRILRWSTWFFAEYLLICTEIMLVYIGFHPETENMWGPVRATDFWKPAIDAHTGFLTKHRIHHCKSCFISPYLRQETWMLCFWVVVF
jgi:hypothetical protein